MLRLTGRQAGGVASVLPRTEMSRAVEDGKVTRSAECVIQPRGLTVGEVTCYRESPHINLMGAALASANTLASSPDWK